MVTAAQTKYGLLTGAQTEEQLQAYAYQAGYKWHTDEEQFFGSKE